MYQTEILDLKNTMNEMKTETESTTIRIKQTEERIWEIEDRKLEIIQSEENKEKEWKRVMKGYMIYGILYKEPICELL